MSRTIDERVVSLKFDNSGFERNVSTSMSTLDKLKQKLNLPGSAKAFENINSAASKVNLNGLNQGVEALQAKFSSLDVVAVTALANITNSAVNAGKNMISALTIDPITSGFREYEMQMNSVQTILANTASKGTTINDVTAALDELNTYADKTIYNFAQMTHNIGTFTAAGVDLDKSVAAIKGIANLGAMSGSSAAQVNSAMYQLSQALAAGRVSLMDWNSVVNAGMGGEQFQNALKRTAEHFGYNVDGMIAKYGSFRESLTKGGWLTAEVLTETLNQISGAYTEAELIQQGYTEDQAKAIVQMATTAEEAATKVKTFTQLWDTMKEAAGSGWAKTWQTVLGDFEEAKDFFTDLSEYFGKMISGSADARNNLLADAFDSNWTKLTKKIQDAGVPLDTFTDRLKQVARESYNIDLDALTNQFGSLEKAMQNIPNAGKLIIDTLKSLAGEGTGLNESTEAMTQKLEYFQDVVDRVWKGEFKNAPERYDLLAKAGYDYAKVQDLVNKTVDGHKLTLADLTEEQAKAIGFTDEQVKALKELAEQAEKTGTPLNELINNLEKPSGRQLFLESIKNTLMAIIDPLRAIKRGFNEAFAISGDDIYGVLEGLHRFSEAILMNEESLDKLSRTFRGIFGVFRIFTSILSGGLGLAFNVLTSILENFNLHILDVTAFIGDILYGFSSWITSGQILGDVLNVIVSVLGGATGPLGQFVEKIKEIPAVQDALESIKSFFEGISNYFSTFANLNPSEMFTKLINDIKTQLSKLSWEEFLSGLSNFGEKVRTAFSEAAAAAQELGPDIIAGLQEGLSNGVTTVIGKIKEIAQKVIEAAKAVLGIHSPSTEFISIGKDCILGLINGLKEGLSGLIEAAGDIVQKLIDVFQDIDWGSVAYVGLAGGIGFLTNKGINVLDKFGSFFEGFGGIGSSIAGVIDGFEDLGDSLQKFLNAKAFSTRMDGLFTFAKAIALLAGSLALLTLVDQDKLISSGIALGALAGGLVVLSKASSGIGDTGGILKISVLLFSLGTALLMMSGALKIISTIDPNRTLSTLILMASIVGAIGLVMLAFGKLTKLQAANISKVGSMVLKMAAALLIISVAMKILASISEDEVGQATEIIFIISGIFAAFTLLSKLAGKSASKAGSMFLKFAAAIGILAVAIKLIGMLSEDEIDKGLAVIGAMSIFCSLLTVVSYFAGESASKAGSMFLKFALAVGIIALAMKSLASLSEDDITQGMQFLAMCSAMFILTTVVSAIAEKVSGDATSAFLKFAAAVGILAIVVKIVAGFSIGEIMKGMAFIAGCELLFGQIVAVSMFAGQHASKAGSMLLKMAGAVAILAITMKLIGLLEPSEIAKGIVVVGALSIFFSLLIAVTSLAGPYADQAGSMLMKMAVPIGVIAASIGLLSLLDPGRVAAASASLSLAIGAFALLFKFASNVPADMKMGPILALSAMVAVIGYILSQVAALPAQQTLSAAASLSLVLLAIVGSLRILDGVKGISIGALAGLGATVVAVGLIAAILGVMSALDIQPSMETALALSTLLLAMAGVTAILAIVGAAAPAAIAGAAAFDAVVAIIGGLMIAIGALMTYVPQCEEFLDKGIVVLEKIGYGIGSFFGNIIGGFIGNIGSGLPEFATQLSQFMTNLQPFIDGANSIEDGVGESMANLAKAILIITAADVIDGITSWLTGGSSMADFGSELAAFGEGLAAFGENTANINPDTITAAAKAAKTLAEMAATIPNEGGWLSAIVGENDMGDFGAKLGDFGAALTAFSDACANIVQENIDKGVNAAKGIIGFAKEIPNEGGLLAGIVGDNSMGTFATDLGTFGGALTAFSDACANIAQENVDKGVNAAKGIIGFAKEIPNEGLSLASIFVGDNSLGQFGEHLASFGTALSDFSANCADIAPDNVTRGTEAAKALVDLANDLPDKSGGLLDKTMSLPQLGTAISQFGPSLARYAESVAGVDAASIESSANAIKPLVSAIKSMNGLDSSGAAAFKNSINTLAGANISGFVSAFSGQTEKLKSVGSNLGNSIASGFTGAAEKIKSAATSAMTGAVNAINSKVSAFKTAGTKAAGNFTTGIKNGTSKAKSAAKSMVDSAAKSATGAIGTFSAAGLACATGFASGIASGAFLASAQAYAMGRAAANAAKRAIDSNSPSKVFKKIGSYVPQGFAIGIGMYGDLVKRSASGMASEAIDGTRRAINRISDAISSDVDAQPTIRPVVDLSDVTSGANAINTMLGMNPSVGLMSSVGNISAMMNRRQNGANSDVVDAIKDLDRSIAKSSGPSYTINGITYDRGTEVADAIETLVRATRIEGRV